MLSLVNGVSKGEGNKVVGHRFKEGGKSQIMKHTEDEDEEFGFYRFRVRKGYFSHTFKGQEIELKLHLL